jgi:hypothetical protein
MTRPTFAAHPEHPSTAKLWTSGTDLQLQQYFSFNQFLICPLCNIIVDDLNELKSQHRNAPGFFTKKKELYNQRKFISKIFCPVHNFYEFSCLTVFQKNKLSTAARARLTRTQQPARPAATVTTAQRRNDRSNEPQGSDRSHGKLLRCSNFKPCT